MGQLCPDVPLDIVASEYRDLIEPLLLYLAETENAGQRILNRGCSNARLPSFLEHFLHDASASI